MQFCQMQLRGYNRAEVLSEASHRNRGRAPFVLNYRVDDLDGLLVALRAEGVAIDPKREDHDYGRFAWITDPEGNKIELWEPPEE